MICFAIAKYILAYLFLYVKLFYIDVSELQKNGIQEIEMHFKLENVDYYTVSVVNEKTEKDMELLPQDLNKTQIVLATILTLIII